MVLRSERRPFLFREGRSPPCHSEKIKKPFLSFRYGQSQPCHSEGVKAALVIPRRSQTDEGIFSPSHLPPCKQTLCHLGYSAANAENRPCRSFCPPTRQRFRPFRALYRTRLQPYGPQGHISRICVLASSLAPRNGKSTVPQCFYLRGGETGTLDNNLQIPSSCHSGTVKVRLLVIPRRLQTDEGIFPAFCQPAWKQPLCHLGYSAANATNQP